MIYNSNGGFIWSDVYHMPIKLREFYWNQLVKSKKTETEQLDAINKGKTTTPSKVRRK
jgi:hypothetical protein